MGICRYSYLRRFPQRTTDYDIALLRLSEQVDLTTYTPVCLPRAGADHTGETAWMVGWGVTSYGGTGSNKLLEVISCCRYVNTPAQFCCRCQSRW